MQVLRQSRWLQSEAGEEERLLAAVCRELHWLHALLGEAACRLSASVSRAYSASARRDPRPPSRRGKCDAQLPETQWTMTRRSCCGRCTQQDATTAARQRRAVKAVTVTCADELTLWEEDKLASS